jgi:hypothetical protein
VSRRFQSNELMSERALEMGRLIAGKSPVAVVSTKHLMNRMSCSGILPRAEN